MANTKISALTAATTPLAGTEVLPIVQSGVTKKVAVSDLTAGRAVSMLSLTSTNDATINGLTVGKGGGAVSTNTAVGVSALAAGTTAGGNTAVGNNAGKAHSTGGNGTYIGANAGYTNQAGNFNTFVGLASGYTSNYSGNAYNTCFGAYSGYGLTTGIGNTLVGSGPSYNGAGSAVTSGNYNTIIGAYNGSTAPISATGSNYIVFSDGQGNVPAYFSGGNLIPTAASKGINFTANTPAAGMTSQLLNWYEEGIWTPTNIGGALVVVGTFSSSGVYTRIGRQVTVQGTLNGSTSVAISGGANVVCGGLPFSCRAALFPGTAVNGGATASAVLYANSNTTVGSVTAMAATSSIFFSITYMV